ncbi:MAG TPA: sigma-70 family RNA polymerase sigma factor [Polyangiaceae bacterium]|nr:sigma-70 family RNA polymerase sigma factor [Polyangiaceae bacterium]
MQNVTAVEPPLEEPAAVAGESQGLSPSLRLERAARDDFQFIWRCLRRFGVQPEHCVDDAAQRVFEIAALRISIIEPGHERAFLFKTALWVAQEFRRKQVRPREVADPTRVEAEIDGRGDPERLLEERRWRDVLDVLLDALPMELRSVFVLYELEELHMLEIANLLQLAPGTVASRLRRARAAFHERARRFQARGVKP